MIRKSKGEGKAILGRWENEKRISRKKDGTWKWKTNLL
jgi:hypothetical protein